MPGIRTSMRTTSGRVPALDAQPPPLHPAASPTTSMSGWASRIIRKPARIKRLVVDDHDAQPTLGHDRGSAGRASRGSHARTA